MTKLHFRSVSIISFGLLSLALFPLKAVAENHAPAAASSPDAHASPEPGKPEAKKESLTIEGLYLGRIGQIDPKGRYLYLLPEVEGLRKKTFFIDRQTKYRKNRKPFNKKKLQVGQKVAVRFFGEGSLLVALGVFVVEDEFELGDYTLKR